MDKKEKIILSIGCVLLIVIAGYYFLILKSSDVQEVEKNIPSSIQEDPTLPKVVITFDENGFKPNPITIKGGQRVEWVNKSSTDFWPASNIHPTHTLYPNSSIWKCGTSDESAIFDACRPIPKGGSYSFVFKFPGEWRYHDHVRAYNTGTITVQK